MTSAKRKNNVFAIDSHPMDSRFEINGDVSPTVTAKLAKGSADGPLVMIDMKAYAIEGNVVDRVSTKNGKGWCENVSPTLNTQDRHAVVYTIDAMSSNSMKSPNPNSGIHETQVAKCLDTMCLDPSCNQGGHMVVIALEGNGARPSHLGNGYSESETMYTLNTIEQHSVCYSVDCRNLCTNKEVSGTLQAKNVGGFSYNYLNPVLMETKE